MSDEIRRIALQESVTQKEVTAAGWRLNWLWQDVFPRSQNNPHEIKWVTRDKQTSIHYMEDFLIEVNYILAKGKDANEVIEQVRASLATYSEDDVRVMWEQATSPKQKVRAIYFAAIAAPQKYDPESFRFFERAFTDPDGEVRMAAIVASGYLGWPELKEILQQLTEGDPDADVRKNAQLMLEGMKETQASDE